MTTPLASASNATYTVEFDGVAVRVLGRHSRKVRATMALGDLRAVELTPARPLVGGFIRFRTSRPSRFDRIVFNSTQQPDMERFVQAVAPHVSMGSDSAANGLQPPAPARTVRPVYSPREGRLIRSLLTLTLWTEGIYLALLLVPIVVLGAFAVWYGLVR